MNKLLKYLKTKYLARKFVITIALIAIAVVVLYAHLIDGAQFIKLLIAVMGFYHGHDAVTTYIESKTKQSVDDEDKQRMKDALTHDEK